MANTIANITGYVKLGFRSKSGGGSSNSNVLQVQILNESFRERQLLNLPTCIATMNFMVESVDFGDKHLYLLRLVILNCLKRLYDAESMCVIVLCDDQFLFHIHIELYRLLQFRIQVVTLLLQALVFGLKLVSLVTSSLEFLSRALEIILKMMNQAWRSKY